MILRTLGRIAIDGAARTIVRSGVVIALACAHAAAQDPGTDPSPATPSGQARDASPGTGTDAGAPTELPTATAAVAAALPSFKELEAAGAVIGEIQIDNQNIFDLNDPKENNALFRLANKLHIRTRDTTLRKALLFKSGERLSVRLIEETERLLRGNRYLYDVRIEPVAYHDGVVDIKVTTRDTWTLDPGLGFSRQGGVNSTSISLKEYNLLGTGTTLALGKTSDVDRNGTVASISTNRAFDGWTILEYRHGIFDDGKSQSARIERPFYALDTRWAAGATAFSNEAIGSIYNGGNIVGQYRRKTEAGEIYGGLSNGLIDGWVQRYSIGLQYQNDDYRTDPSLIAPATLPPDEKLVSPFLRYEVLEDNFAKLKNRNQIERVEYFPLGFNASVQLGFAAASLGSTRDLWLYSGQMSDGYLFEGGHNLQLSGYARGRYGDNGAEHQVMGAVAKYFYVQGRHGIFFVSLAGDTVTSSDATEQLLLGGDNGLRGYPLRYQSGDNRAQFSMEERGYTNWYPFRLFRVGGAIFYDLGRAWGGTNTNTANPGWLSDVGFGLRILNDRTAIGNVLHVDLAFPLNGDPSIKSYQFSVKSKVTF